MQRIYIENTNDIDDATDLLDESGIEYDFDSGNRMMLDDSLPDRDDFADACRILDLNGIPYQII